MLFRPEEIHVASPVGICKFASSRKRNIHMPNDCGGINLHNDMVPHPDLKWLATIQATTVNTDLHPREQPAHGQRFQASLGEPLHFARYCH